MGRIFSTFVAPIVSLVFLSGAVAFASDAPVADPGIDAIAQRFLETTPLAGMTIAVARGEETIHLRGYGFSDLENRVPAKPDTVYRIGSVTKNFTAAATLRLVDQGRLALEDDMTRYLADYPTNGRRVTIRHLLNHTSGIRNATEIEEIFEDRCADISQDAMLAAISQSPFDFEPGEQFRYNNSGYWLLGVIIEKVTGESYAQFVETELFRPLGLERTRYDDYRPIIPDRAHGYTLVDGQLTNAEGNSPTRPFSSGALLTTAPEMVRWLRALFSGSVISPASLKQMITPGTLNNGASFPYGFGFRVNPTGAGVKFSHGGVIIGFQAFIAYYPAPGLYIAVLTNTLANRPVPAEIESQIAQHILGPSVAPEPERAGQ